MTGRIWLVIALVLWGFLHSLSASLTVKTLVIGWLGDTGRRFYRLGYNLFAGISFLPIPWLAIILPDKKIYEIPVPWIVLTFLIQILAAIVLMMAMRQTGAMDFLGMNGLLGKAEPRNQNLYTGGLYGFVRHPIYSASLVLVWCSPVMTLNRLVICVVLSVYIAIGATFEERKLIIEFGNEYREYQRKVPMLIPGVNWNKSS
jgi:protein-S-isoprenylcysteine O-methyltransferase Ste14